MSEIILRDICKSYENGFQAVKDFMIAGLEDISDGELWIGDKLVNYLEPKERDLEMVFQSYALYPQMNIYDNIAFSLQVRKVPKKEIDKRFHLQPYYQVFSSKFGFIPDASILDLLFNMGPESQLVLYDRI